MIIGLVGSIGAGKSTVGDILVYQHGYLQVAFADTLKDVVSYIFSWPRIMLEGKGAASRTFREKSDTWWSNRLGYEVTPRLMLQKVGTEAMRDVISPDIWIASLEKHLETATDTVITDCRFSNEIEAVKNAGGVIVYVSRTDVSSNENTSSHSSEIDWKNSNLIDYTLNNNGTLEDLENSVAELLTNLKKKNTIFHHSV